MIRKSRIGRAWRAWKWRNPGDRSLPPPRRARRSGRRRWNFAGEQRVMHGRSKKMMHPNGRAKAVSILIHSR